MVSATTETSGMKNIVFIGASCAGTLADIFDQIRKQKID